MSLRSAAAAVLTCLLATTLQAGSAGAAPRPAAKAACAVRIAEVTDLRSNPESMGMLGGGKGDRMVRIEKPPEWVRAHILALASNEIRFVDAPEPEGSELVLKVDLLKSYVMALNMGKTANVVVRVGYSRKGSAIDEKIYRGGRATVDWLASPKEGRGALDDALDELLVSVRGDMLSRCGAGVKDVKAVAGS